MSDFASAAMLRIMAAGMRMDGLAPFALPQDSARVSLDLKRQLLASAIAQGGLAVLPRLGRGIAALRGDPVHQALAHCAHPAQLMQRWCRLERYIHSRHRIGYADAPDGGLWITHRSLRAAQPPLPQESLVVLGVLAAALEETGAVGVRVQAGGKPVYPVADAGHLQQLADTGQAADWHLTWTAVTPGPARGPWPGPSIAEAAGQVPGEAQALARLLLQDLMQAPSLKDAARSLGKAPRSLQRQLAADGLSYTAVVAETRCRAAAWQLVHRLYSVAETGLLCGFSDQAHFTRTFSKRVGVSPARYQREFARVA